MSEKERDRLKVLHEVKQGHLSQRQAAGQTGMSERGFRKLLKRFRKNKDLAVVHGLRGRRSNRGVAEETARKAVEAVRQEYRDFGPTLAAEYLDKDLQISLSRETLRQLMIREGIWKAKHRRSVGYMCRGRGAAVRVNWCSGIPACKPGWKIGGASPRCRFR